MKFPTVTNCCSCISLRAAGLVLGVFGVLGNMIGVLSGHYMVLNGKYWLDFFHVVSLQEIFCRRHNVAQGTQRNAAYCCVKSTMWKLRVQKTTNWFSISTMLIDTFYFIVVGLIIHSWWVYGILKVTFIYSHIRCVFSIEEAFFRRFCQKVDFAKKERNNGQTTTTV